MLVAFALHALAQKFAPAADRFGALARLLLGRLLEVAAELHLAEHALALHLLFQGAKGLIDIVVAHDDLNDDSHSSYALAPLGQAPVTQIPL